MRLSLVIPAYNEAGSIGRSVARVCAYLDDQPYDWEVIIVIDGGPTAAADEARAAAGQRPNVRVLENTLQWAHRRRTRRRAAPIGPRSPDITSRRSPRPRAPSR